jgi:UPF0755 protein
VTVTRRKICAVVAVLVVGAAAAAAVFVQARLNEPFRGYSGTEQFVEVPGGAGSTAIGRRLIEAGVVRDELTFRLALWRTGAARRLQAGEYRFERPLTALEVVDRIAGGDVHLVALTFREGLTIEEMARVFEENQFGSASEFLAAARDPAPIRALDPAATDLEGYLFPDTYRLPRGSDANRVVAAMVGRFQQVLTAALREEAKRRGLSVRELVTLASLVEKETARADERTLVAAVYANRLETGMGLQCDPTVIYALQRAGRYTGNLSRDDLQFDSPYNTYRYRGLPPGPIAAPGQASLAAAARPAEVDYLYFVSRNDGSHEFARSLAEHNRNVQKFQVQYFRDLRRASRAGGPGR